MARDDGTSSRHADDKARFKQYDYMAVRGTIDLYNIVWGSQERWNGVVMVVVQSVCLLFVCFSFLLLARSMSSGPMEVEISPKWSVL